MLILIYKLFMCFPTGDRCCPNHWRKSPCSSWTNQQCVSTFFLKIGRAIYCAQPWSCIWWRKELLLTYNRVGKQNRSKTSSPNTRLFFASNHSEQSRDIYRYFLRLIFFKWPRILSSANSFGYPSSFILETASPAGIYILIALILHWNNFRIRNPRIFFPLTTSTKVPKDFWFPKKI